MIRSLAKGHANLNADDLAQNVAIKLSARKSLKSGMPFRWLQVVVKNTACDMYRKQTKEQQLIDRSVALALEGQAYRYADDNEACGLTPCQHLWSVKMQQQKLFTRCNVQLINCQTSSASPSHCTPTERRTAISQASLVQM